MGSPAWLLNGNAGTDPANNYVGTSDTQPLMIMAGGDVTIAPGNMQRFHFLPGGDIGVNTDSPKSSLEILNTGTPLAVTLTNSGSGPAAIDFNTALPSAAGTYNPSSRIQAQDNGNFTDAIVFLANAPGGQNNGLAEIMTLFYGGMTVNGGVAVTGNISVTGDVLLTGADCAEQFDVADGESPEPGTVVVIDQEGALRESSQAYDRKVAGVVSGAGEYRHALVLDKRASQGHRVPIALIGKVYCKVDADICPVEVGDLLTTSPTRGHAMKAIELSQAFGSVIGKALQSLGKGKGLIPIMVTMR